MSEKTFHAGGYGMTAEVSDSGQLTEVKRWTCTAHGNAITCETCYRDEVAAFKAARNYVVYVEETTMTVTTFAGRRLGSIQLVRRHKARYTPTGGRFRMTTVHVRSDDGSQWWGRGCLDSGSVVCLHRIGGKS